MLSIDQLNDLRKRVLNNEEVSPEEYSVVIEALRKDREASKSKSPARATKPKKTTSTVDSDALLDMFGEDVAT